MTLWAIGIGLSLLFAITNAVSFKRGSHEGYQDGLKTGVMASFQKLNPGEYTIIWGDEEDEG